MISLRIHMLCTFSESIEVIDDVPVDLSMYLYASSNNIISNFLFLYSRDVVGISALQRDIDILTISSPKNLVSRNTVGSKKKMFFKLTT